MSYNKKSAEVFHFDLYGKRQDKYDFLNEKSVSDINWNKLDPSEPTFFLTKKNFEDNSSYNNGFSTNELFINGASGIKTERDSLVIHFSSKELKDKIEEFKNSEEKEFRTKYKIAVDGRDWKLQLAKDDILRNNPVILKIQYRPFDFRYTYYTGKTKGFHAYPRKEITRNFLNKNNLGIIHLRQNNINDEFVTLVTNVMTEKGSLVCGNYYISPLYTYPETNAQQTIGQNKERTPNLNMEIVNKIASILGLNFTPEKAPSPLEKAGDEVSFAPIDILDYIYAVLHSPTYREKYKEFLKIDFPRIPYPKDTATFWQLVKLGGEIRQIHLLESPTVEKYITQYPVDGTNIVSKPRFVISPPSEGCPQGGEGNSPLESVKGCVYINDTQYFGGVPEVAWNFYIGGYQPAQKWLKDRKGRKLEFDDILHYQKIIVALTETDRIMKEIDKIEIE